MGCQGGGGKIWSQSMGCQGGGEKFDKRNVVLELESLKAWVAKGGENLIKGMLSGRVAKQSMGCQGGGRL